MKKPEHAWPPELEPGTVIEFDDISELPTFEDLIVPLVEPNYDTELWAARPPINEALRPRIRGQLFYGRLGNITLTIMPEPYKRLLSAPQRGWVGGGRTHARSGSWSDEAISQYLGFEFSAEAFSSARKAPLGMILTELWYFPSSRVANSTEPTPIYGEAIRRVVARPKFDKDKFIELDEQSRRIGLQILREAIEHPLTSAPETKRLRH